MGRGGAGFVSILLTLVLDLSEAHLLVTLVQSYEAVRFVHI